MSEMSARASRRAFCFGSCTINGLTERNGPVLRLPGVLAPAAGGGAGAGAGGGGAGRGGGAAGAGARGADMTCASGGAEGEGGRPGGGGGAGAGAGGAANGVAGRAGAAGRAGMAGRLGGATGGAIAGRDGGRGGGGAGARGGTGVGADATGRGAAAAAPAPSGLTAKTLLQTLQRARSPPAGTFAGSTRYTVSHDGQVTFTPRPRCLRSLLHSARDRGAGQRQRPIPPASSRSSSFPSPAR